MMKNIPHLLKQPGSGFWFDCGIPKAMRGWPVAYALYHANRSNWQINLSTKDEARAIELAAVHTGNTTLLLADWRTRTRTPEISIHAAPEVELIYAQPTPDVIPTYTQGRTANTWTWSRTRFRSVARTVAVQTPMPVIAPPSVATSAQGRLAAGSKELITQHVDQFITDTLDGKYSTIRSYRCGLDKFIAFVGVRPVRDYTAADCAEWYTALTKTGNKHNSIVKDVRAVKAFFRWAKNRLLIAVDPAADLKVDVVKNKSRSWEQFTLPNLHAMFDPLAQDDHRRLFLLLVLHTGLDPPSEVEAGSVAPHEERPEAFSLPRHQGRGPRRQPHPLHPGRPGPVGERDRGMAGQSSLVGRSLSELVQQRMHHTDWRQGHWPQIAQELSQHVPQGAGEYPDHARPDHRQVYGPQFGGNRSQRLQGSR
jgi:hypothetical protein